MRRLRAPSSRLAILATGILGCALATASPAGAQAQETPPLTNDDILKMVQAALGDAVIVAKIKSSPSKFDTRPDNLIKLKQSGVSGAILQAMAEAGVAPKSGTPVPGAPTPDPNEPLAVHDPGIYYLQKNRAGRRMLQLEPTAFSQAKSNMFAIALTTGIYPTKMRGVVRGRRATLRIAEPRPTFYFYFVRQSETPNYTPAWPVWFAALSGPNQFTLARFKSKKNERELVVGEFGIFNTSFGIREEDTIKFDFEKLASGTYKVTPRTDMELGEYCFVYLGQNGGMGLSGNLSDFGINSAQ